MQNLRVFQMSRAAAMALAMTSSTAVLAQELTLEEVVITAQKREESLQSANLSVRAITPDDLQRAGVQDISSLSKVAPEVTVDARANGTVVSIRGVRSIAFGPTDESANALHIDGGYLARFQGLRGLFYDLQRVEVLSGPQGTLYGRNATGGAINMITTRPGQEFGGYANLEVGNYSLVTAETAINLPISDNFAVRVSGRHFKHDGYFTDTGTDDADQNSGRLSALWNITDTQSLFLTADIAHEGGKGPGVNLVASGPAAFGTVAESGTVVAPSTNAAIVNGYYVSNTAGNPTNNNTPMVVLPDDPRHNSVVYGAADKNYISTQLTGFLAQYDNNLGPATLTLLGSYRELKNSSATGTAFADSQPNYNVSATLLHQKSSWKSFEARLTSTSTEPLKWVAGLYWFNERLGYTDFGNYVVNANLQPGFPGAAGPPPAPPAGAVPQNPWTAANPTTSLNIVNPYLDAIAYAAFGEMTWTPIDKLHITGGLRYNVDKKEARTSTITTSYAGPVLAPTQTSNFPATGGNAKDDWSEVTWRLNVGYDITDTNRVYVNAAKGYKSGGFAFGPRARYEPEYINAYEIGSKNEFMNNRVRLNAAAWYYDYKDFEIALLQCTEAVFNAGTCNNPNPVANPPVISVTNAGSARNIGASLSLDALVTDNDKIGLSAQYVDAKFKKFNVENVPFIHPFSRFDYSGTRMPQISKVTATGSYTHTWQIGDGKLDAQVAAQYASDKLLQNAALPGQSNYLFAPSVTTVDISSRWAPSEMWSVTAYVNNVSDKLIVTGYGLNQSAYAGPGALTNASFFQSYGAPRTYGAQLNVKF